MNVSGVKAQVDAIGAGARSGVYSFLARAYRWPEPDIIDEIIATAAHGRLAALISALPFDGGAMIQHVTRMSAAAPDISEMESAYIACFEFGTRGETPCFLYEGEHGGGRLKVMEDVLRFYDHFGLEPAASAERPDHISTECEFMHYLTFQEAATSAGSSALCRAQLDFLRIHLCDLATEVGYRLGDRSWPLYPALALVTAEFVSADRKYLERELGRAGVH